MLVLRFFPCVCVFILFAGLSVEPVQAGTDLTDIISSLYGGDGIVLRERLEVIQHSADFQEDALEELAELATLVSEINLPVPSGQAGFTYQFDPVTNEFVQTDRSLGPIFSQRAETVGKNKFTFGIALSHVDFSEFEGDELDDLSVAFNHEDEPPPGRNTPCIPLSSPFPNCHAFENDQIIVDLDVSINSQILTLFGSYGFTDKFEAGLVVPILRNHVRARAKATIRNDPSIVFFDGDPIHVFDPAGIDGDAPNDSARGTKTGIGDVDLAR